MSQRIHYTQPSITELEVSYVTDAARNGWGEHCYDYINRFEAAFREHLGVKHAIATSSCTGALHLGMAALDIGDGDEAILADTNWIASVAPVVHPGAKPVFVDILPDTWCADPAKVEAAITPRTRAIIAVHLYGNLCDMDALLEIGARHGVPVIEDAAEAIGSVWKGKRAGSMGTFGTFSFHGTKTVTTGEGGVSVTNDDALYEQVLTLSNHGRARGQTKLFWPDIIGFKYKMSNIQAAIGCAQIEPVDELIQEKRRVFLSYSEALAGVFGIAMNPEPDGTQNGFWMPIVVFDESTGVTRERLLDVFREENIDARVFFWPLSSLPPFEPVPANTLAYGLPQRAVNLLSYHEHSVEEIERVSTIIVRLCLHILDMCDAIEAGGTLDPSQSNRKVLGLDIDISEHNRAAIEAHPLASPIQVI